MRSVISRAPLLGWCACVHTYIYTRATTHNMLGSPQMSPLQVSFRKLWREREKGSFSKTPEQTTLRLRLFSSSSSPCTRARCKSFSLYVHHNRQKFVNAQQLSLPDVSLMNYISKHSWCVCLYVYTIHGENLDDSFKLQWQRFLKCAFCYFNNEYEKHSLMAPCLRNCFIQTCL